jgi:hypothetical protein
MPNEHTGQIPFFLNDFLQHPASMIPKGAQWVVQFDDIPSKIFPAIEMALRNEPEQWMIEKAFSLLNANHYQTTKGCMFAQAIDIPGESMVAAVEGTTTNNLIRGYVGQGRNAYPEMRMTFLDTNVSFVDNVIRPWVIATARWGLVARSGVQNYRTNLTCYRFGVTRAGDPPSVLSKIIFKDLCAISCSNEEFNYAPTNSAKEREAKFIYSHYTIDTQSENSFMINNRVDQRTSRAPTEGLPE